MSGYEEWLTDVLTVDMCISICLDNNFTYAGMQYYRVCYCDNAIPTVEAPASECNAPCDGNTTQICGGTWRLRGIIVDIFRCLKGTQTSVGNTLNST